MTDGVQAAQHTDPFDLIKLNCDSQAITWVTATYVQTNGSFAQEPKYSNVDPT